jgi:hypothetical protein
MLNPVAPLCAVNVALVVTVPVGVVHAPVAAAHSANPIEPILAPVAVVAFTV